MDFYKRKIKYEPILVTDEEGRTEALPMVVQVYITQNIEDLGIYEDVGEERRKITGEQIIFNTK